MFHEWILFVKHLYDIYSIFQCTQIPKEILLVQSYSRIISKKLTSQAKSIDNSVLVILEKINVRRSIQWTKPKKLYKTYSVFNYYFVKTRLQYKIHTNGRLEDIGKNVLIEIRELYKETSSSPANERNEMIRSVNNIIAVNRRIAQYKLADISCFKLDRENSFFFQ